MRRLIEMFQPPSAAVMAQRDHDEAERQYLQHKAAAEYHDALAGYYERLIKRLREGGAT